MKNILNYILLLTLQSGLNAFAWGTPDLVSANIRQKAYTFETALDKNKAFKKLLLWSAKTFADSNEVIKLKDAETGMMVVKGNLSCKALKLGSGYGEDQRVKFTLEFSVENKKIDVKVTDLIGTSPGSYDDSARPSTKEEAELAFKECIDPFIDLIKAEYK